MEQLILNGEINPFYFVDRDGNVYTEAKELMRQHESSNGYVRVKLSRGTKRGMYLVHRLIAETFLENPHNLPIVHHKNDIRGDNRAENLEWCNNSYNQKKRYEDGKHVGTKRKKVAQIDLQTNEILVIWDSPILAKRELGIQNANIIKVCAGERKQAGGFGWKYI